MIVRKEKGFTLIELMVVVLIIAILVAIAVPVFNVARDNAWRRSCQANLRTIDGAIQTYYASYEGFPSAFGVSNLVDGDFLKAAPQCPEAVARGDVGSTQYVIVGSYPDINAECPGENAGDPDYANHTY